MRFKKDINGVTRINTPVTQFNYILGVSMDDVIPFEDSTIDMEDMNLPILPRHYHIFANTINNVQQFKPYEFDQYRICVAIHNNIIIRVESIG